MSRFRQAASSNLRHRVARPATPSSSARRLTCLAADSSQTWARASSSSKPVNAAFNGDCTESPASTRMDKLFCLAILGDFLSWVPICRFGLLHSRVCSSQTRASRARRNPSKTAFAAEARSCPSSSHQQGNTSSVLLRLTELQGQDMCAVKFIKVTLQSTTKPLSAVGQVSVNGLMTVKAVDELSVAAWTQDSCLGQEDQ